MLEVAQLVLVLGPGFSWSLNIDGLSQAGSVDYLAIVFQKLKRLLMYLFIIVSSANNYGQRHCLGNFSIQNLWLYSSQPMSTTG